MTKISVQIDDHIYFTSDPVATGQQLLTQAGKRPTDEYLLFQNLENGQLEEIRLDETVDPGVKTEKGKNRTLRDF